MIITWQDIVISLSIIFATYALIPQVLQGFKVKKKLITTQTSLIYTIAIYSVTIAFFTLELYFSAIMDFIMGTLWLILLIQSIIYK